jgi:hypothetical protein
LDYSFISGLNYNLYEQNVDANGLPVAGDRFAGGKIDAYGQGEISVNPDPRKSYALQIYDRNASVGDFWYFNEIQFVCGENKEITKQIPKVKILLRNSKGELKKNYKFSLYTEKADADAEPIKEKKDLIANDFNTGEKGETIVYLSPKHPYDKEKSGNYVFSVLGTDKAEFIEYGLHVDTDMDLDFSFVFSDIILNLKTPTGLPKKQKNLDLYEQSRNGNGDYVLGKRLKTIKTDDYGSATLEYPAGYYALVSSDDIGQKNIFWNIVLRSNKQSRQDLTENNTRLEVKNSAGQILSDKSINMYAMKEVEKGLYTKDKKIKTVSLKNASYYDIALAPAPYLFTVFEGKIE